jgi:hypothetical protein
MIEKTRAWFSAGLVALAILFGAGTASGYAIVLQPSQIVGPVSAPVTIYIVWGVPGALTQPTDRIEFHLEWDCQGFYVSGNAACAGEHGSVVADYQSASPQYFSDLTEMARCLAILCECMAHIDVSADIVITPPPGVPWPLAVFEFSREGWDITNECARKVFDTVVFRTECLEDPACDGGTSMTMTFLDVPVETTTWGRLKALMRSGPSL